MLKRVLPKHSLEPLSPQHEICTNYYAMGGPPTNLEEISIEERLAVLYSPANYWKALSEPKQENPGKLRFATNVVIYALTHGKISDYSGLKPK
jgi:hypothetical protein